jgi:4'-phosphopantetheinyl transferase
MQRDIHSAPELPDATVHIWRIPLTPEAAALAHYQAILVPDERARAARFHFEVHRRRFTVARARMRIVLASYMRCEPAELAFSYASHGKPFLADSSLTFNLSHAHEMAILGVTSGRAIGVDIEHLDAKFAGDDIAARYFSEGELRTLRALPQEQRCAAFFRCWTRKEAYIKARGEGLSIPLASFEVCLEDREELWLNHHENPGEQAKWQLQNIVVPAGYIAAVVAEGRDLSFRDFDWSDIHSTAEHKKHADD